MTNHAQMQLTDKETVVQKFHNDIRSAGKFSYENITNMVNIPIELRILLRVTCYLFVTLVPVVYVESS